LQVDDRIQEFSLYSIVPLQSFSPQNQRQQVIHIGWPLEQIFPPPATYFCLMAAPVEKLRIDKYLWAIRLFKTRSLATAACDSGKVRLNGQSVKPARPVVIGDKYEVKTEARRWTIQVLSLLPNRVGYEEAIKHYADLSTEEDRQTSAYVLSSFFTGKRLSKTGRPTKKQRRDLGEMLGSDGAEPEVD
jgi:ribosome-associated heat shock protein Hsp15